MHICVLVSAYTPDEESETLVKASEKKLEDPGGKKMGSLKKLDNFVKSPANFFPQPNMYGYTFDLIELYRATSYRTLHRIVKTQKYDCFFVLCDGCRDEDRAGEEVVEALEEFNVPYTGVDFQHFDPMKVEMKKLVDYDNIHVPPWIHFREVPPNVKALEERMEQCGGVHYPVIVKHPRGFNSIGMTKASKCHTSEEALERIKETIRDFQGALLEEFIIGDEVTVLALQTPEGTKVLPPIQMSFPEGEDFKHFDLKWTNYLDINWFPMSVTDVAYNEVIRIGKLAFESILGGIGFGRSDIRIEREHNRVYFIEMNPNPGIMYPRGAECSADWILRFNEKEFGHQEMTHTLIQSAFANQKKRQKIYIQEYIPKKGFHLLATRNIAKDEVVIAREGKPQIVVTKPYVMREGDERERRAFERCASALDRDGHVYGLWEGDWVRRRPVLHSCAPNLHFAEPCSLNLIAAHNIQKGEILTVDYATFCDETTKSFACHCGASICRGNITLDQSVATRYGKHAWRQPLRV